jgi:thiol-disulfide isomerase/thioredoxin
MKALVLCLLPMLASAQTRTITDGGHRFVYTDTAGVTASYVGYLGPRFDPGPLTTFDGQALPAPDSGQVTVYNFWFVSCPPCVAEIPTLNRVAAAYKDVHVRFVALTWDPASRIRAFLSERPFQFSIVSKPVAELQALKKVSLFPCTVITDGRGRVTFVLFGRESGGGMEALYALLDRQVGMALKGRPL